MSNSKQNQVPRSIFFIIALSLVGLYVYGAFIDHPQSEQTVNQFYQAYFASDYETVAENISVFGAAQYLPNYMQLPPDELMASRKEIEQDMAKVLASTPLDTEELQKSSIEILPDYTKEGSNSALVVYSIKQEEKKLSTDVAVLIKEQGKYRIFSTSPVDAQGLNEIRNFDMDILDENFSIFLE